MAGISFSLLVAATDSSPVGGSMRMASDREYFIKRALDEQELSICMPEPASAPHRIMSEEYQRRVNLINSYPLHSPERARALLDRGISLERA